MAAHNDLGKKGEELATGFLKEKGYHVVATNWRNEKAEADIIATLDNTVIIVEVKTRATSYFGAPEESVGKHKQRMMVRAAEAYIEINNINSEVRYDIISIINDGTTKQIVHIEDAFYPFASEIDE